MKYFVQTIHYSPDNVKQLGLCKINDIMYENIHDNSQWVSRALLDVGWGREKGFCRLPILHFDELFKLAIKENIQKSKKGVSDDEYNLYGAISILLDDHPLEFINRLKNFIENEYFNFDKHQELFEILESQLHYDDKLIYRASDSIQKELYIKWKDLSSKLK